MRTKDDRAGETAASREGRFPRRSSREGPTAMSGLTVSVVIPTAQRSREPPLGKHELAIKELRRVLRGLDGSPIG